MAGVRIILIGGFLGAGKTTLLARAAESLVRRNLRVALVTNDQAKNLVDTALLTNGGFDVREVAGGCFCCRLDDLLSISRDLMATHRPDVIVGEPVGSCTDISATVINPLKKLYPAEYHVSPLSVLADPVRLAQSFGDAAQAPLPASVVYIFRKQLEEADAIVINKIDSLASDDLDRLRWLVERQYPGRPIFCVSAANGTGVEKWMDFVLSGAPAGRRIAEVDYDIYAEGEAVLGWLNATVQIRRIAPEGRWSDLCRGFFTLLDKQAAAQSAQVAHAKLLLTAGGDWLVANVTSSGSPVSIRGRVDDACPTASLVVNARVRMEPDALRKLMEECLTDACGTDYAAMIDSVESFSPSRPNPLHRFGKVVE